MLSYELRRERHAIGEFLASVQLFQPIGAAAFADVVTQLREVAATLNLPAAMPVHVLQPPGLEGLTTYGPPTGVGFQRFSANGEVAASILCDGDEIIFRLREYSIWEEVKPIIVDAFGRLLEQYIKEVPAVKIFKLQYLNEFLAKSDNVRSTAELFKSDNEWIAPFGVKSEEPWHCHVGRFIPVNENLRYLVNIHCDVSTATQTALAEKIGQERNLAKVLVLAGCYYNVPGGKPLIVSKDKAREALEEHFEMAHSLEKNILRELISDSYLDAMGALDAGN
jgi:uncharacterized protein (TIGR04255 family)